MDYLRFRDLQTAHLRSSMTVMDRARPLMIGAGMGTMVIILLRADYPAARTAWVGGLAIAALGWQVVRARFLERHRPASERVILAGLLGVNVVYGAMVGVLGGLRGPLVAMLLPMTIAATTLLGGRKSVAVLVESAIIALALALMPVSWQGPLLEHRPHMTIAAIATITSLVLAFANVRALTAAFSAAGDALDRTREQMLVDHAEHTRSLESVGAKVAHELKNPLAAIKGLIQLLAGGAADQRARERFDVVDGEVRRMEVILRDYLSFSRPLEDLKPRDVDVASVIDDVLAVLEARAALAEVALTRLGEGANVVADPRRLKEALLNLIANALEATPRGGTVTVEAAMVGRGAEIVIRDAGRGIPADVLPRIGTPYYTTRAGGTGLGVVLARSVVQQHGGSVRYASELGRGTTVTVTLPARPREPGA